MGSPQTPAKAYKRTHRSNTWKCTIQYTQRNCQLFLQPFRLSASSGIHSYFTNLCARTYFSPPFLSRSRQFFMKKFHSFSVITVRTACHGWWLIGVVPRTKLWPHFSVRSSYFLSSSYHIRSYRIYIHNIRQWQHISAPLKMFFIDARNFGPWVMSYFAVMGVMTLSSHSPANA